MVLTAVTDDVEVKKEADSNVIPECSHDDIPPGIPTVGMFVIFSDTVFSAVISMCVLQLFSCCELCVITSFSSISYTVQSQRLVLTPDDHSYSFF